MSCVAGTTSATTTLVSVLLRLTYGNHERFCRPEPICALACAPQGSRCRRWPSRITMPTRHAVSECAASSMCRSPRVLFCARTCSAKVVRSSAPSRMFCAIALAQPTLNVGYSSAPGPRGNAERAALRSCAKVGGDRTITSSWPRSALARRTAVGTGRLRLTEPGQAKW